MPQGCPSPHPAPRELWWSRAVAAGAAGLLGLTLAARERPSPTASLRHPDLHLALAENLAHQGLTVAPHTVALIDPPEASVFASFRSWRAALLAHRGNEPLDVYLVRMELTPEARLLRVQSITNLTDTSAVNETHLTVSGSRIAFATESDGQIVSLFLSDLARPPKPSELPATWLARLQLGLTNLQERGQFSAPQTLGVRLRPSASRLAWGWSGGTLHGQLDGEPFSLDATTAHPPSKRFESGPCSVGDPGSLLTWAVDRVRGFSWFGTERMQLLKTLAFEVFDRAKRTGATLGDRNGEESLSEQLGGLTFDKGASPVAKRPDWPPSPLKPLLTPALPDEGVWKSLERDPFVGGPEGTGPDLLFSFVRTDPARRYSQVFVVLWDPREVELRTMTGTREPKTATGETGPGRIPRQPDVLPRLVGAFNGGFQATHGEFGMMADGVVYLPPKPYAATVARLTDGSTGFGTWPNDETILPSIVDFRQNLTPLLADDKDNPYQRTWWGGVPQGWQDATRTVRTGLCLTQDGFIGYFYASFASADRLGAAMRQAHCQYGIHLDMNPGHTGMEFYRVGRRGTLPGPQRKLDSQWEARGPVEGMPGWEFLGRRMIRLMNLMNFPRYVGTESRDFFYLLRRHHLPLPALPSAPDSPAAKERTWETLEAEGDAWPPAVSTTQWQPSSTAPQVRLSLVALDAKWLRPPAGTGELSPALLDLPRPLATNGELLGWKDGRFVVADAAKKGDLVPLAATGSRELGSRSIAAIGLIADELLVYAEIAPGADAASTRPWLARALGELGATAVGYLPYRVEFNLAPKDNTPGGGVSRFVRGRGPAASRLFSDTPIVPSSTWAPLQGRRVRYLRQPKPVTAPTVSTQLPSPAAPESPASASPQNLESTLPGEPPSP